MKHKTFQSSSSIQNSNLLAAALLFLAPTLLLTTHPAQATPLLPDCKLEFNPRRSRLILKAGELKVQSFKIQQETMTLADLPDLVPYQKGNCIPSEEFALTYRTRDLLDYELGEPVASIVLDFRDQRLELRDWNQFLEDPKSLDRLRDKGYFRPSLLRKNNSRWKYESPFFANIFPPSKGEYPFTSRAHYVLNLGKLSIALDLDTDINEDQENAPLRWKEMVRKFNQIAKVEKPRVGCNFVYSNVNFNTLQEGLAESEVKELIELFENEDGSSKLLKIVTSAGICSMSQQAESIVARLLKNQ